MEAEKKKRVIISEEEIKNAIKELASKLNSNYKEKSLLVVSLLKGSFIFTADLVRQLDMPVQIEFMTTSSYGHGEETSGNVNIVSDLKIDINKRDVLIVDDIMDSGLTMKFIIEHLKEQNPSSVKSCVLLDKPERRTADITPDYVGITIPDVFIGGYGLNYGDYYRNIPYIFSFED